MKRHNQQRKNHFRSRHSHRSQRHHAAPRQQSDAEKKFLSGTPIDPDDQIVFEKGSDRTTVRAIDLICPIGKGQRGLIVAPPGSGKTTLLKDICQAMVKGYPEVKLYCLLIDERPEEVTDFTRSVDAEVFSSSTDQSYDHHIETADQVMEKAFVDASNGKDVMVIIDSLTRLARVHNAQRSSSGRTMSGGVDARAMEVPRRIFGAARNIEGSGSLTILASILVETGSRMDDVIFEEFKGTGNMEMVLARDLAQRRYFPAIDIPASNTRKLELMMSASRLEKINHLRRALLELGHDGGAQALIDQFNKYPNNELLLDAINMPNGS